MIFLVLGFKRVPVFSSEELLPETGFSIVIPFRNEAENLPILLETIENLNYPETRFEVIFVNDASEDFSEKLVAEGIEKSKFSIKLLQNKRISGSPKKDAISEAIAHSKFAWIVTTDADCELPKNWLKTLDCFIQKNKPSMVCGPVIYESNRNFLENFQQLDGLSLQAVTIGSFGLWSPVLCNGANLVYRKAAFLEVNGFSGNDDIASGDDIFLLEKMKEAYPRQIHFLKCQEAIISTKPRKSWKNVINQRIRWASKTAKQKNPLSVLLGILVLLVNLSIITFPFLLIFDFNDWDIYLFLFCFKIVIDYITISHSANFFDKKISILKFAAQSWVYATIVCITVMGSFSGKYAWKGRIFKKQ